MECGVNCDAERSMPIGLSLFHSAFRIIHSELCIQPIGVLQCLPLNRLS